jgi:hypothetical protein
MGYTQALINAQAVPGCKDLPLPAVREYRQSMGK